MKEKAPWGPKVRVLVTGKDQKVPSWTEPKSQFEYEVQVIPEKFIQKTCAENLLGTGDGKQGSVPT